MAGLRGLGVGVGGSVVGAVGGSVVGGVGEQGRDLAAEVVVGGRHRRDYTQGELMRDQGVGGRPDREVGEGEGVGVGDLDNAFGGDRELGIGAIELEAGAPVAEDVLLFVTITV